MTTLLDTSTELQEQARQAWRASVATGAPLSRQALGDMFGKSASWGRDRIAEVRAAEDNRLDTATDTPDDTDTDTPPHGLPAVVAEPAEQPPAEALPVVVGNPVMTTPASDMTSIVIPTVTPAGHHPGARFMAWVGFALGSVVSVAGNWLHAWLPAGDNAPGWAPSLASQVGAAVWPVALLVSVEVLSRTAWQPGWLWALVRLGGVGVVALGSGVISYGHIHGVLLSWGYDPLGAGVGPLVIDGLMVVSGFALLAMSSTNNTRKA
jgi:hypothetical protein